MTQNPTPVGDIPATMLKPTDDIHASILTKINLSLRNDCFPYDLKAAEVSPMFKKMMTWRRKTISLSVFCFTCQRSLKRSCILKSKVSWKMVIEITYRIQKKS